MVLRSLPSALRMDPEGSEGRREGRRAAELAPVGLGVVRHLEPTQRRVAAGVQQLRALEQPAWPAASAISRSVAGPHCRSTGSAASLRASPSNRVACRAPPPPPRSAAAVERRRWRCRAGGAVVGPGAAACCWVITCSWRRSSCTSPRSCATSSPVPAAATGATAARPGAPGTAPPPRPPARPAAQAGSKIGRGTGVEAYGDRHRESSLRSSNERHPGDRRTEANDGSSVASVDDRRRGQC